jgi:hypothetical protein
VVLQCVKHTGNTVCVCVYMREREREVLLFVTHDRVVYKPKCQILTGGLLLFAVHHSLCEYMLIPSACCTFNDISLAN